MACERFSCFPVVPAPQNYNTLWVTLLGRGWGERCTKNQLNNKKIWGRILRLQAHHWARNRIYFRTVLQIRDVYPGSEFFLSWIRIKKFKYGMIRVLHPDPDFLPFPESGSRGQKGSESATLYFTSLRIPLKMVRASEGHARRSQRGAYR